RPRAAATFLALGGGHHVDGERRSHPRATRRLRRPTRVRPQPAARPHVRVRRGCVARLRHPTAAVVMASYRTAKNGRTVTVDYTDGDVLRDVADLLQVVPGEYEGSTSSGWNALRTMLQTLQGGAPL